EVIRLHSAENVCDYVNRGSAYADKKDYERAIADFTEAIRIDSTNSPSFRDPLPHIRRANAYFEKRDYDRAIGDLTEAIRLDPTNPGTYQGRGCIYFWVKKDYDRAIADFTEAIRRYPENAYCYSLCAWLWATCPQAKVRNGQKALEYATK